MAHFFSVPRLYCLVWALFLLALCTGLAPAPVLAADTYDVGFRTLGQWYEEKELRLDVNVWYPSIRKPRDLEYTPWTLHAARNGKAVAGHFPLIILSHDSPATRFSYHTTAAWLASCGFVVAAPTHTRDSMTDMSQLYTWEQMDTRAREISGTIDLLLRHEELSSHIDGKRIGLLGYGSGGTAALFLGGALPNCTSWMDYCQRAGAGDVYCQPWARKRINMLCGSLPLTRSLADPRIKAVVSAASGFGMLFDENSFDHFYPPLLLIAVENDSMKLPALHSAHLIRLLGKKVQTLILPTADTPSLMSPCPKALAEELPELCLSVDADTRSTIHRQVHKAVSRFFLRYLGSEAHVPQIPPPPDLTPPAPVQPLPAALPVQDAAKDKKSRHPRR